MFDVLYLRRAKHHAAKSAKPRKKIGSSKVASRKDCKRKDQKQKDCKAKDCNVKKLKAKKIGKAWQKLSKL